MKPEDVIADRTRPYTGAEYMQSLRDGREVYIDGERVADVTTHPALRNSVRSIARLYDALHDPKHRDVLTCPTDTGSGGYTHRFFRVPRSREDLRGAQAAIAAWSRMTYGWMGRTPDYKAAYSNTLGGNAEYYGPYAGNARAWYKRAQETVPFMNHAIVNPPIDRHKPAEQVKDVYVSVQKETDGGIIVSGAKVVATSAAITHYNFMGQSSKTATEDLDMSLMFMVPIDAPGLKLICRTSYEKAALRERLAVRLSAVVAVRRERRDLHPRQRVRALGGRVHLSRSRAGAELLSAFGLHARASSSRAARASR